MRLLLVLLSTFVVLVSCSSPKSEELIRQARDSEPIDVIASPTPMTAGVPATLSPTLTTSPTQPLRPTPTKTTLPTAMSTPTNLPTFTLTATFTFTPSPTYTSTTTSTPTSTPTQILPPSFNGKTWVQMYYLIEDLKQQLNLATDAAVKSAIQSVINYWTDMQSQVAKPTDFKTPTPTATRVPPTATIVPTLTPTPTRVLAPAPSATPTSTPAQYATPTPTAPSGLMPTATTPYATSTPTRQTYTSSFACTGSMEPYITCLDTGIWLSTFTANDISVGSVISFTPGKSCDLGSASVSHRIISIKVEEGQTYYLTKGDANYKDDGCWTPLSAVNGVLVDLKKGSNPTVEALIAQAVKLNSDAHDQRDVLARLSSEIDTLTKEYDVLNSAYQKADNSYTAFISPYCSTGTQTCTLPAAVYDQANLLYLQLEQARLALNANIGELNAKIAEYNAVRTNILSLDAQVKALHCQVGIALNDLTGLSGC